jgi:hypothetical protein
MHSSVYVFLLNSILPLKLTIEAVVTKQALSLRRIRRAHVAVAESNG